MSETAPPDSARALIEAFQAMGRVLTEWVEQWRPVCEQLAEVMNRPEVRAAIEQRQGAGWRSCHCLCGKMHPADTGICEAEDAVTARRYDTELLGPVDVPLCAPCAAAQGLAELMPA